MDNENDIEIKITIDEAQARAILEQLDGSIKNISLSAEQGSKSISIFESAITTWNQGLELAQKTINGISGTFNTFISAIEQGSAINDVASAFENLTTKAGGLSDVFLNDLKAATGETISSFELMQKANQALQAGIKPDQYVALTQAARALAEETGGNLTEELSKLERAFATGQDRFLKNRLGIIDLEKAQQSLANSLGTTIDKLTEEQKTYAARNAIVDASIKKAEEFGKVQIDAGDQVARVSVIWADFRDELLRNIATSTVVAEILDVIAEKVKTVTTVIRGAIRFVDRITGAFDDFVKSIDKWLPKWSKVEEALKNAAKLLPGVGLGFQVAEAGFNALKTEGEKADPPLKKFGDRITEIKDELEGLGDAAGNAKDKLEDFSGSNGLIKYAGEVERLVSAYRKNILTIDELGKSLGELDKNYLKAGQSGDRLAEVVGGSLSDALDDIGEKLSKTDSGFQTGIQEALGQGFVSAITSLADSLFSGDGKKAINGLASAFGSTLSSVISEIPIKSLLGKGFADALAGAGGAFLGGPIGSIIGQVGGSFVESIVNSIVSDVQKGDYSGAISTALDSIFPGVGSIAGGIVDSLFGGGDSAGTEAKKSADKFFADIFDANRVAVVIDGKLTEISDLVFSGNQDGGLFSSLPAATQAAFAGIGTAFEGLLGIAGDLGVNIGNVFANNLGGSLNNLQILVQQTGISFDQLRDQVVKAFLDGKLSATQAAEALRGIEQISQKGIPDALGAVDQAFQNLIDSGTNGGAALVDALGDIAAEATELSITSLDKVREFLTQSGKFTEAQISQIFAALAANGIDSIDELQNVTAEQAIQIVAALESAGFAFSETGSAVTNIAEELNNIPSEINTIVRVRYVAEGDSAAAEAVGQKIQDVTSTFTPSGEGISTTSSASSGSSSRRPVGGLA